MISIFSYAALASALLAISTPALARDNSVSLPAPFVGRWCAVPTSSEREDGSAFYDKRKCKVIEDSLDISPASIHIAGEVGCGILELTRHTETRVRLRTSCSHPDVSEGWVLDQWMTITRGRLKVELIEQKVVPAPELPPPPQPDYQTPTRTMPYSPPAPRLPMPDNSFRG
jgi:hypothetical protein